MIKLDLQTPSYIIKHMAADTRNLNSAAIRKALTAAGMTQKALATQLDVSGQAVTNWLKGKDFPRPATLLKLALLLNLPADQLIDTQQPDKPIVAFRKKGLSKTTKEHIKRAEHIGMLLRPMVPYFPNQSHIRPRFSADPGDLTAIMTAANQTRVNLGKSETAAIQYSDLIDEFKCCGAVVVPVLWGKQEKHKNALHIHLPAENFTFIFLNLDTRLEDFKFWMAHELAHVYSPDLAGSDAGEDFADSFAGSLLFSSTMEQLAYKKITASKAVKSQIFAVRDVADTCGISALTVYRNVARYAKAEGLAELMVCEQSIHQLRNSGKETLVSESFFGDNSPTASLFLQACTENFKTDFFSAFVKMSSERDVSAGYLQQVMSITAAEARELYQVLMN